MGSDKSKEPPKSCPTNCSAATRLLQRQSWRRTSINRQLSSRVNTSVVFDTFEVCSEEEVQRTINSSQSKTCALDPLPTDVLKQFLPELLPYITDMCNASLQHGNLPLSQRRAIVTPRLKKSGMDEADVKSYRPISNLTFMSKTVERLVCRQLVA